MKIIVVLLLLFFSSSYLNTNPEVNKTPWVKGDFNIVNEMSGEKFISCSDKMSDQNAGFTLMINDTSYNPEKGEFLLMPGIINQAAVKIHESFYDKTKLKIVVTRRLPDGRSFTDKINSPDKEGNFTFDLGPVSAAPEYDYEAGKLFVRGYRLLSVIMKADKSEAGNFSRD